MSVWRDPMAWAAGLALLGWALWRAPSDIAPSAGDPLLTFLGESGVLTARPEVRAAVTAALVEALAADEIVPAPDEARIVAWYQDHVASYATPPAYAVEVRRIEGDPLDARVMQAAWSQLAALRRGNPPVPAGLPLVEGPALHAELGAGALARLDAAPLGEWSGPIVVDGGLALIRVAERRPGGAPTLDAVRARVVGDVQAEMRREAVERRLEAR